MAKLFDTSKKYTVELDIAEAHTIQNALAVYLKKVDNEDIYEYTQMIGNKINTVYERYASELNNGDYNAPRTAVE